MEDCWWTGKFDWKFVKTPYLWFAFTTSEKLEIQQKQNWLGLRPRPSKRRLQRSLRPCSWISGAATRNGGEEKGDKRRERKSECWTDPSQIQYRSVGTDWRQCMGNGCKIFGGRLRAHSLRELTQSHWTAQYCRIAVDSERTVKSVTVSNQLLLIHYILQSKQTDHKILSKNTNKRPLLRPVTFFRPEV